MTTLDALRSYLSLCEQRAGGTLALQPKEHSASIYPFTRDEWLNEARLTRESIEAWEEAEAHLKAPLRPKPSIRALMAHRHGAPAS